MKGSGRPLEKVPEFTQVVLERVKARKIKGVYPLRDGLVYETGVLCKECDKPLLEVGVHKRRLVSVLVCEQCRLSTIADVGMVVVQTLMRNEE